MKIFEHLQHIKTTGPICRSVGICYAMNCQVENDDHAWAGWRHHRKVCMESWAEFSGNAIYPVPSCEKGIGPGEKFDESPDDEMWNPDHPYGAARLRLLDHCIEWFKSKDL